MSRWGSVSPAEQQERIVALRDWAKHRIAQCRRDEDKFARLKPGRPRGAAYPDIVLRAVEERMALQAVLRFLDGPNGDRSGD